MESVTYSKNLKISPKKLRFLLFNLKKQSPDRALELLMYMPKKSAKILYQVIKSAIVNAKNTLKVGDNLLKFKTLGIDEGNKLKRFQPGGRGTAKPYVKRFSHVKVVLEARENKLSTNKKTDIKK